MLYFTDGDNDDMRGESKTALHTLAAQMAANPRLACVALIGVNTRNWTYWNDCFACLGDRLIISGENDIQVDAVLERLQQRHFKNLSQ